MTTTPNHSNGQQIHTKSSQQEIGGSKRWNQSNRDTSALAPQLRSGLKQSCSCRREFSQHNAPLPGRFGQGHNQITQQAVQTQQPIDASPAID
jgi:hypothetical protein